MAIFAFGMSENNRNNFLIENRCKPNKTARPPYLIDFRFIKILGLPEQADPIRFLI